MDYRQINKIIFWNQECNESKLVMTTNKGHATFQILQLNNNIKNEINQCSYTHIAVENQRSIYYQH